MEDGTSLSPKQPPLEIHWLPACPGSPHAGRTQMLGFWGGNSVHWPHKSGSASASSPCLCAFVLSAHELLSVFCLWAPSPCSFSVGRCLSGSLLENNFFCVSPESFSYLFLVPHCIPLYLSFFPCLSLSIYLCLSPSPFSLIFICL